MATHNHKTKYDLAFDKNKRRLRLALTDFTAELLNDAFAELADRSNRAENNLEQPFMIETVEDARQFIMSAHQNPLVLEAGE